MHSSTRNRKLTNLGVLHFRMFPIGKIITPWQYLVYSEDLPSSLSGSIFPLSFPSARGKKGGKEEDLIGLNLQVDLATT